MKQVAATSNNPSQNKYDFGHVQQHPPPSSYMPRAPTGSKRATASRMGGQQQQQGGGGGERPTTAMKSNQGAGYTSYGRKEAGFNPAGGPTGAQLEKKPEKTSEEQFKEMEREVNTLLEESSTLKLQGKFSDSLDKAKDAANKERNLRKQREQAGLLDQINIDLTYSICFNLANCYQANQMYQEAINTYTLIVKNKQYPQAGILRVNMGNIYFSQGKYSTAIKMYRMALDLIPKTAKELRFKIMKNIGHAHVKLGQFADAVQSFESIVDGSPDFLTGFHLILCYYALGDKDRMKKGFTKLLSMDLPGEEEEEKQQEQINPVAQGPQDALAIYLKEKRRMALKYICDSGKLIAPEIEADWIQGFDWVIETLKAANCPEVEAELETYKAIQFIKRKDFETAISVFKGFERKDKSLMARAATNISFLYFLEADFKNAEKYADVAIKNDRYNAKALVNKGNCLFIRDELDKAKELYLEAIGVEADCVEAIYNLGLVNRRLELFQEALQAYEKLQTIVQTSPEVMLQIAQLYQQLGNTQAALKWYNILATKVPSDPRVLLAVGAQYARDQDDTQAFHYYQESFRYYPVNLEAISWLGIFYVRSELYEKACQFFQMASQIQPQDIKWKLMVASCYRRMGDRNTAQRIYEEVHAEKPDNLECVKYLVSIGKETGQNVDHYLQIQRKLEREQEQQGGQQQQIQQIQQIQQPAYIPQQQQNTYNPPAPAENGMKKIPVAQAQKQGPQQNLQMRPGTSRKGKQVERVVEEDEFGDTDLPETFLPM